MAIVLPEGSDRAGREKLDREAAAGSGVGAPAGVPTLNPAGDVQVPVENDGPPEILTEGVAEIGETSALQIDVGAPRAILLYILVEADMAWRRSPIFAVVSDNRCSLEMTETLSILPASSGGYEMARFNALRHGVLSRYTVLPWEDAEEYRALVAALAAEHAPQGPTEEHLVEELAGILWRKRRLRLEPSVGQVEVDIPAQPMLRNGSSNSLGCWALWRTPGVGVTRRGDDG